MGSRLISHRLIILLIGFYEGSATSIIKVIKVDEIISDFVNLLF